MSSQVRHDVSLLTDRDIYLFREGTHNRLHEKLGAHALEIDGAPGVLFAVWAPNAREVAVIGDFNDWDGARHGLAPRLDGSGIWEGFIPGLEPGIRYKFRLRSQQRGYEVDKGDPFARCWEVPPRTASIVCAPDYVWNDGDWMRGRDRSNAPDGPWTIYEVHLGSWRRVPEDGYRSLHYVELADQLTEYVSRMGFTHVELLPVMEHPFYGSWGYQTLGYFAPSSRYGSPPEFKYLVDRLHQAGIGVILDWVPSHFPSDEYGLAFFDGTHLFEHADRRQGYHPEWNSYIFNFGRHEVRAFLLSSARLWLDEYHADALRVDAVASMLYLDYARQSGQWIPNRFGGKENLESIEFIQRLNESVYRDSPGAQTIAEESTAWPMVSRPTYVGGLGFGMKWNMGWMHDMLEYFGKDPVHRKYLHDKLTFSIWYAFTENFLLPLSHDEVVYGKGSLIGKMPGDDWQKFANLRALFGFMYGHPGKKLVFMGGEFGQRREWNHDGSLEWHVLDDEFPRHRQLQRWVHDLNQIVRCEPALHGRDFEPDGFAWIDFRDWEESVISFLRRAGPDHPPVLVVCNFTPVPRPDYRIGVPCGGYWRELANSDSEIYGGSNTGNSGGANAEETAAHGHPFSLRLDLPPLGVLFLKPE